MVQRSMMRSFTLPLIYICRCVEILLEIQISPKYHKGQSPLHLAALEGHAEVSLV